MEQEIYNQISSNLPNILQQASQNSGMLTFIYVSIRESFTHRIFFYLAEFYKLIAEYEANHFVSSHLYHYSSYETYFSFFY